MTIIGGIEYRTLQLEISLTVKASDNDLDIADNVLEILTDQSDDDAAYFSCDGVGVKG